MLYCWLSWFNRKGVENVVKQTKAFQKSGWLRFDLNLPYATARCVFYHRYSAEVTLDGNALLDLLIIIVINGIYLIPLRTLKN